MKYDELVKALRHCAKGSCDDCNYLAPCLKKWQENKNRFGASILMIMDDAAAAIEELLSFAHYVADKVTMSDEDWEDYHEAFTEVACRKLVKLGVISIEDDMYVYRQDKQRQEVQDGTD